MAKLSTKKNIIYKKIYIRLWSNKIKQVIYLSYKLNSYTRQNQKMFIERKENHIKEDKIRYIT